MNNDTIEEGVLAFVEWPCPVHSIPSPSITQPDGTQANTVIATRAVLVADGTTTPFLSANIVLSPTLSTLFQAWPESDTSRRWISRLKSSKLLWP